MSTKSFLINFGSRYIVGDIFYIKEYRPSLLFLHGGGSDGRKVFSSLRKQLLDKGIGSYAFDFIGHGESIGDLNDYSLKKRTQQTQTVIKHLNLSEPISIVASSMGGYTAIDITQFYRIDNLILLAPAVYDKCVYDIPFGKDFSKIIRKESSWKNTDAWDILKSYKNNLLIFVAQNDQVIPSEVTNNIYKYATGVIKKDKIVIKNSNHSLIKWLNQHKLNLQSVSNSIFNFLNN